MIQKMKFKSMPGIYAVMLCISLMVSAGCSKSDELQANPGQNPGSVGNTETGDWNVTVISDQLIYPWEVRISSGTLIITEADGNIVLVDSTRRLQRYAVQTSERVVHDGGSGLLGLALAQDFATSGTAFAYYTYNRGTGLINRIVRLHFNGTTWSEAGILLDNIPGHRLYNGGRLAIGPDGFLYASTGWTASNSVPQDLNSLGGKILRLTTDGGFAPGNPFPQSYIYSYGHRNPQGLAWDAQGQLFAAEHGQSGNDEINRISAGSNYGWPLIQGDQQRDGMTAPYLHSGNSTWGPSGITFTDAGDLLVASLVQRGLYALNQNDRTLRQIFSSGERIRNVAADGNRLYVISTNTSPQASSQSSTPDRLLLLERRD